MRSQNSFEPQLYTIIKLPSNRMDGIVYSTRIDFLKLRKTLTREIHVYCLDAKMSAEGKRKQFKKDFRKSPPPPMYTK